MAIEAQSRHGRKNVGSWILNFSHNLAHGVGENVIQPAINIAQYRTFENPAGHRKEIDKQMFRTFRRAASTLRQDHAASLFLFTQFVLAVGLGEHVPIPLSVIPFIPHNLDSIPLPFDLHLNIPIPPTMLANHVIGTHFEERFKYDGNQWPLFTSDFIMSGAVNIPNTWRAFREKRPSKVAWYALSVPLAFTHIPVLFNSFWFELATRPAERKEGKVFAEKVSYVLEGSNAPQTVKPPQEPKTRLGKIINWIPGVRRLREMATGETHIKPKDRHIFADAVKRQLTEEKPQKWWEQHLQAVKQDIESNQSLGIPHEKERIAHHEKGATGKALSPRRLWHAWWKWYHEHMLDRLEEKQEAGDTTIDFIRLATQPTLKTTAA